MGYQTFAHSGKNLIKSEDIGAGQVDLRHLSPALFNAIQLIQLHNHSGVGSSRMNLSGTEGFFPITGFKMVSPDGTKFQVTIENDGDLVAAEIT